MPESEYILNGDCYVAFLDIMGYKTITLNKGKEEIEKVFETIIEARNNIYVEQSKIKESYHEECDKSAIRIMSDSIVIAVDSSCEKAFEFLCRCCCYMQRHLIMQGVLSRGGISKGNFVLKGEVMFGSALTEAYLIESNIARHPRIVIDRKKICEIFPLDMQFEETVELLEKDVDDNYFVEYLELLLLHDGKGIKGNLRVFRKLLDSNLACKDEAIRDKYVWLKNKAKEIFYIVGEDRYK